MHIGQFLGLNSQPELISKSLHVDLLNTSVQLKSVLNNVTLEPDAMSFFLCADNRPGF